MLANHLERVSKLGLEVGELGARTSGLEADLQRAFRRVGLVRFNPFEDTGSNQSFALALLDDAGDGIIVTSLHARGLTRIYAKAVGAGRPEATLSEEEAGALAMALGETLGREALRSRSEGSERTRRGGPAVRRSDRAGA